MKKQKILAIAILLCLMVTCLLFAACEHVHQLGDWQRDVEKHWRVCSCGYKQEEKHKVTSWTVDKESTETEIGARHGLCDVCGKNVNEDIPKLEHKHVFDSDWKFNNDGHWKECSCSEKETLSPHDVKDWVIDKNADDKESGFKHGTCLVCKTTVMEIIPPIGHVHSFVGEWQKDETGHWKKCDCGVADQKAAHIVTDWTVDKEASDDDYGIKSGTCQTCGFRVSEKIPPSIHAHNYNVGWSHDDTEHWKACACGEIDYIGTHNPSQWIIDKEASLTSSGSKHKECLVCERVLQTSIIPPQSANDRTVDFYAINDFHGATNNMSKIGGYLNDRRNENPNTLFLNSGDMFQGSMESNSNYGKLLSDCMDVIGFDAFTFGNHEFDWGLDNLRKLANESATPFLGANIYNWNAQTKTWGTFADDLAKKYEIKTLDNGLKVGIIGVIGQDQITSISSNLVQTIGFKAPLPIIKELSLELRNEYDCDVVVVSAHVGPQGLVGESDNKQEPTTAAGLENYVDAVFCAHSHANQNYTVDGLPFIQGQAYGSLVSHVQLNVSPTGSVTCLEQNNIARNSSWSNHAAVDRLIAEANDKIKDEAMENLGYIDSNLSSSPALPRLVCRAMTEYAKNLGHGDIVLAMTNNARSPLNAGTITYTNLYQSLPFDNIIYIAEVRGRDILSRASFSSNSIWRIDGRAIESDGLYKIAIIDYLLFHQDSQRDYNYFPSAFTEGRSPIALTPTDKPLYNYREITRDYLRGNSVNVNDYISVSNYNNSALLYQTVELDGESIVQNPEHLGSLDDPFSVSDAILLMKQGFANEGYVKGTVSDVSGIRQSTTDGRLAYFYIKDESGAEIMVYYIDKFSGASLGNNWDGTGDISVGDELVIRFNKLEIYNSIYEVKNGYCVSINGIYT